MARKYEVGNQLTGISDSADTFEEIKSIRAKNIADFIEHLGCFKITILEQNEEGGWVQSIADENGNPIPPVVSD